MWGFKPKVHQILPTVEGETPATVAMVLVDRWVDESGGVVMVVRFMITAILSSPWVLGVPDLGASESVPTPNNENRFLYLSTVCAESESF